MTAEFEQEVYAASELTLKTKKRHINPRSETQGAFIDAMNKYEMVFGLGPAGTGTDNSPSSRLFWDIRLSPWRIFTVIRV